MNRIVLFLAVIVFGLAITACSNQQFYDSMQHRNQSECAELPLARQEDCLQEIKSISYDDYLRELEKLK